MVASSSKHDVLSPLLRRSPFLAKWLPRSRVAEQAARDLAMLTSSLFRYRPVSVTYAPPPTPPPTPPATPAGPADGSQRPAGGSSPFAPPAADQAPHERLQGHAADHGALLALRLVAITDEAEGTRTLHLERPAGFTFEAGQFLTLLLPVAPGPASSATPPRPLVRSYSLCSAPDDPGPLRIGVKRIPDGLGSSFLHSLVLPSPGDASGGATVTLNGRGPSGAFVYRPSAIAGPHRLVLVAGGSGITPILSIVKTALARRADVDVVLLYAVRTLSQAAYLDELRALAASSPRLTLRVFAEDGPLPEDMSATRGRIDSDRFAQGLRHLDNVYLCGPDAMTSQLADAASSAGLPSERIHRERFFTPQEAPVPARRDRVRLHLHGVEVLADPQKTILETALAAGLAVPFSCTMGGCGECKARLAEGQVSMAEPNCLSSDELEDQAILPCICYPLTDIRLDYPDRDTYAANEELPR